MRIPGLGLARHYLKKTLAAVDPLRLFPVAGSPYTLHDLADMNARYGTMHDLHRSAHVGAIEEIGKGNFKSLLEVACGSGWNIPFFNKLGVEYYGLDLSETALAVSMMRYPEKKYFNLGVSDTRMIRDGSFEIVYNSSMLEHIGYYKEAIQEMVRLAEKEVWILFFEGLTDEPENRIDFHPHTPAERSGASKDIFGRKVVTQDQIYAKETGWYWNRYSKKKILEVFDGLGVSVEILDKSNRPYLPTESIVVVRKMR